MNSAKSTKESALRGLAADLERVRGLAAEVSASLAAIAERVPSDDADGELVRRARAVYRSRRERDGLISREVFGDPAWDILLDLFIADLEGRPGVPVTSACLASNSPPTSALRWIGVLEAKKAIVRKSDPSSARRSLLSLTPSMREKMVKYFESNDHFGI